MKAGDQVVTAGQARLVRGEAVPVRVVDLTRPAAATGRQRHAPAAGPPSGAGRNRRCCEPGWRLIHALVRDLIRRPVFATVLSLLVMLVGVVSYTQLAVREYPRIDEPVVNGQHALSAPRPR